MKKVLFFLILLSLAAVKQMAAQSCGSYFPMTNQTYQYKLSQGDGDLIGSYVYEVIVKGEGKATLTRYQLRKNGKVLDYGVPHTLLCDAKGAVLIPDSTMIPYMSIGKVVFPEVMEVGQTLPGTSVNYFFDKRKPEKKMGFVATKNIKVTKKESVTVPAGTFEAYLIEYDRTIGQMLMGNITTQMKEWYVPGKGMIKMESYMSGKLKTQAELTSVSDKPFQEVK
jgi:hypothetical protein